MMSDPRCMSCVVEAEAADSKEPAACAWYIENVVCGNKTTDDCPDYDPMP